MGEACERAAAGRRVDVVMLGARMHYAVPLMLSRHGLLGRFFTDIYCGDKPVLRWLLSQFPAALPDGLRRIRQRDAGSGLRPGQVVSFDRFGWRLWRALRATESPAQRSALYARAGAEFCRMVIEHGLDGSAVYAMNGVALELFQYLRARGGRCILEQASQPARAVHSLRRAEMARWPDLEAPDPGAALPDPVAEREEAEWALSDRVVCGSQFVARMLGGAGMAPSRCKVVPYGIDAECFAPATSGPDLPAARSDAGGRLNVLFVGAVSLLKGAHYLLQALALLDDTRICCRMVGGIQLRNAYLRQFSRWARCVGPVPRADVGRHYRWADVFVLPSLCEGSAAVTYEAMACGLPVITTPNAGSVVRDGCDGFVVPPRNPAALAAALGHLAQEPDLRRAMAANAIRRVREFSLQAYAEAILGVLNDWPKGGDPSERDDLSA